MQLPLLVVLVLVFFVIVQVPWVEQQQQHFFVGGFSFGWNNIIPNPPGLSQETIIDLARKRYGKAVTDTDTNTNTPMLGKVAVITGAAGGIGREVAKVLYDLGGTVIALDRNANGLDELRCSLLDKQRHNHRHKNKHKNKTKNNEHSNVNDGDGDSDGDENGQQRIWTIVTHHEDLSSVASSADKIKARYDKIDLLINNAGLTYNPTTTATTTTNTTTAGKVNNNMISAHGKDLAFTVNYLSHFLLTQKLLPNLSKSCCCCSGGGGVQVQVAPSRGRIVHITSTYHWKVDGSEIVPLPNHNDNNDDGNVNINVNGMTVLAYESDPEKQSLKHVERSYANTKLAQIWHSRSISRLGYKYMNTKLSPPSLPTSLSSSSSTPPLSSSAETEAELGCSSVCACPTWAATGIGGEESRDILEQLAFPVDGCGAGITSIINAMFRTDDELRNAGALDDGRCFVGNSNTMEYIRGCGAHIWMTSEFVTRQLGWRDAIVDFCGFILLIGQRFTYDDFIVQETSPESFDDAQKRDSLFHWSYRQVERWL